MDAITTLVLSIGNLFGFYALLALGLGFIFGQLRVVNVAHGDFVMVGAYVMFSLGTLPFVVRVLVAALVAIALGLIAETTILRRLYTEGMLATLLAMWGVGIVLRQLAETIFGATPRSVAPTSSRRSPATITATTAAFDRAVRPSTRIPSGAVDRWRFSRTGTATIAASRTSRSSGESITTRLVPGAR